MGKYEAYDKTNRFYLALSFKEFEVFPNLWDEWNPCQVYIILFILTQTQYNEKRQ